MKLIQKDLDFIWAQLTLPGNVPLTSIDSTGIRDVQGVGNNRYNPYYGSADTLFPRLTPKSYDYSAKTGAFTTTINLDGSVTTPTYDPAATIDYSIRGTTIIDASPRIISNLVVNQHGMAPEVVQDNPSSTPGGRFSPLTGNLNPLPYSGFMTMFGQFFDHGLDLVKKGVDGLVVVPLLPGDSLYGISPSNAMFASRTNTISVTIGEGSTNTLVTALGLSESLSWTSVTGAELLGSYTGTLVLNNKIITLAGADAAAVLVAINAATPLTGVTASLVVGHLVLTPAAGESLNTISPFVDLSQSIVVTNGIILVECSSAASSTFRSECLNSQPRVPIVLP